MIYVYDPTSIRVVVPSKPGEGERISAMVERTGAVAGINGGGFDDPDGLGNGFAPIGLIISGGDLLYTGAESGVPQHIVGFTDEGLMIVGKYSIDELMAKHIKEAVTFNPRIIANGIPLITSGDGGSGIQPRTAVGQRADGVVIFIIIDGRQTYSVGATEREVQDLFMKEDVINAGFLDGGASSELVVKGQGLITKPSSRYGERRLPTGFLVLDNPTGYTATRVWDGITKINPGGAFDHPDFLKEQAELKRLGKLNSPTPTIQESPSHSPSGSDRPTGSTGPINGAGESGKPVGTGVTPTPSTSPSASQKPGTTISPTPSASQKPGTTISPTSSTLQIPGTVISPLPASTSTTTPIATPKPSSSINGSMIGPSIENGTSVPTPSATGSSKPN